MTINDRGVSNRGRCHAPEGFKESKNLRLSLIESKTLMGSVTYIAAATSALKLSAARLLQPRPASSLPFPGLVTLTPRDRITVA